MTTASSRRSLLKISLFILLLLVCVYLFLHSSFFKVDKVYVTGADKIPAKEIIQLSGIKKGENLFLVNEKAAVRATQAHLLVRKAQIVRHLPREIEIKIEERKIWALVPFESFLVCIDRDGVCIDKTTEVSLMDYPIITFKHLPSYINLGQAVYPQGVRNIYKVWEALPPSQQKEISEFYYDEDTDEITMYTSAGTEIRWGDTSRMDEKISFLGQTFELEKKMSKQGDDILQYVDLRFKGQPVIKTEASE